MKRTQSLKCRQFREVYAHGESRADKLLVLYALNNGSSVNRLGISVSRKVGKSVTRSRVTRLIREVYRLSEDLVAPGCDLVFIARSPASAAGFEEIRSSVSGLMKKQRVLR